MKFVINGVERELALREGATLAELVAALELKVDRVAVELNREIVARAGWDAAKVADGDKLEIVHFVGGGCDA